jgi:8-oxo-dGTP diphosphatase / 2-hydroxy-dATP diphosphatase
MSSQLPAFIAKQLTLLFLTAEGRVLLGMKKRGFGSGRWNGFGGKIEPNESIRAAAIREMEEESGVLVHDATLVGNLRFVFDGSEERLEVHVFRAATYTGVVCESDEMRPQWWSLDEPMPYATMWPDDAIWYVVRERCCRGLLAA